MKYVVLILFLSEFYLLSGCVTYDGQGKGVSARSTVRDKKEGMSEPANKGAATDISINWEIVNRFRLLKGSYEEERFDNERTRYRCVAQRPWRWYENGQCVSKSKLHRRYPNLTDTPYKTYWNEHEGAYEDGYAQRPMKWRIKLSATFLNNVETVDRCEWVVNGVQQGTTCQELETEVSGPSKDMVKNNFPEFGLEICSIILDNRRT